jgi:hypothetical protein
VLYKHYKGGLYRVIGEAQHSETEEELTIYMSVKTGLLWARPTRMFYDLVNLPDGRVVNRFREMDEDLIRQ